MSRMYLSGYISEDWDGWAMIGSVTFANYMYYLAKKHGIAAEHEEGFGGKKALIKNCSISMYFSKNEMSFEEAQEKFLEDMFSAEGIFDMDANYVGYSEWTITGFDLDRCQLGGHNINSILISHKDEYVNICVECL